MANDKDGVDVGSFVSGYLNKDDTEQKIRDIIKEDLTTDTHITKEDFEAALPSASHRFIRSAVSQLVSEGVIKEETRSGKSVYVPGPNFN